MTDLNLDAFSLTPEIVEGKEKGRKEMTRRQEKEISSSDDHLIREKGRRFPRLFQLLFLTAISTT